jgi:xanthine phosphoribosyltransferase
MLRRMTVPSVVVGWEDVEGLVSRLSARFEATSFDRVLAVARGGLIPATLLAVRLGVRCVESVRVRHYEAARRLAEPCVDGARPSVAGPSGDPSRTLVVDDVLETGGTFRRLAETLPHATFAALVAKRDGASPPAEGTCTVDVAGCRVGAVVASVHGMERWVVFPWSGRDERP